MIGRVTAWPTSSSVAPARTRACAIVSASAPSAAGTGFAAVGGDREVRAAPVGGGAAVAGRAAAERPGDRGEHRPRVAGVPAGTGIRPVRPSPNRSAPAARSMMNTRSSRPEKTKSATAVHWWSWLSRSRSVSFASSRRPRASGRRPRVSHRFRYWPGSGSHPLTCVSRPSPAPWLNSCRCRAVATLTWSCRSRGGAAKVACSVLSSRSLRCPAPRTRGWAAGRRQSGAAPRYRHGLGHGDRSRRHRRRPR